MRLNEMLDLTPKLTKQELEYNVELYRNMRIKTHCQYLNYKRQERYWKEQLNKLTTR